MAAVELIAAITPVFELIGTILQIPEETYIYGVSAGSILYGIGFVGLTLQAYHRITYPSSADGGKPE